MQSPRLKYRPPTESDAKAFADLGGVWDVARMTTRVPYPYALSDAETWLATLPANEVVRCIMLEDTFIGAVGYTEVEPETAEIGYWIGLPYWGRGFGMEAARAVTNHCFKTKKYDRLVCCHFEDNPASARIIANLGFKETGRCPAWSEARQSHIPAVSYERHRSNWSKALDWLARPRSARELQGKQIAL